MARSDYEPMSWQPMSWQESFDKTFRYLSEHNLFQKEAKGAKAKGTGKECVKPSTPIPAPEEVPRVPDEHGRGHVPERIGTAKVRKVRRKRYG